MSSYDAFNDRKMLEKIMKEVRKGECSTYIAFSLSVALVGLSLMIGSIFLKGIFSPWEFLPLVIIGGAFTIYSCRKWSEIDRT